MNELQSLNRKQLVVYILTMLAAGATIALGIVTLITSIQ